MKITLIGTTAYQQKMEDYIKTLPKDYEVKIPAFDEFVGSEYEVCDYNRKAIIWADEVHCLWDQRSTGFIFDLGMCFDLNKKVKIIYLQSKTFSNFLKQYEAIGK